MDLEVTGIDHVYVSVLDLQASERFYDPVMQALGFRKRSHALHGEPHAHYFNRVMRYTLKPARDARDAVALHGLCFRVRDRAAVDEAYQRLVALGVDVSTPSLQAEHPEHYASFFSDPDGTRLEVLAERKGERGTPNLFDVEPPASGESFEALAQLKGTTIERIVSSGTPASDLYDQEQDEWVLLLRGAAELEVAGERVRLGPGDCLTLPSRTPHRVLSTTAGSLWLAVHVRS